MKDVVLLIIPYTLFGPRSNIRQWRLVRIIYHIVSRRPYEFVRLPTERLCCSLTDVGSLQANSVRLIGGALTFVLNLVAGIREEFLNSKQVLLPPVRNGYHDMHAGNDVLPGFVMG